MIHISIAKHKIKDEIRKGSISLSIKPKPILNEVSQEMWFLYVLNIKQLNPK